MTNPSSMALAFAWRWIPPAVYHTIIHILSTRPSLSPRDTVYVDKFLHAIAFAILGVLLARAVPRRRWWGTALLIGLGAALGTWDEWAQRAVPGRDASVFDLMADVIGVSIGLRFGEYIWRQPTFRWLGPSAGPRRLLG